MEARPVILPDVNLLIQDTPHEMTIEEIVRAYGGCARRMREAGLDGVEIHAAPPAACMSDLLRFPAVILSFPGNAKACPIP